MELTSEILLGPRQTVSAEVDRGGVVYYFACKSPSGQSNLDYIAGRGIRGMCIAEDAKTINPDNFHIGHTNQIKSKGEIGSEASPIVDQSRSGNKKQKKSCLNEDLLERYAQAGYKKENYYKRASMTKGCSD